ncbi:MAG: ABC transporter ATP-binding protein [Proteobacteria bacterium]|nr:MAG: ABC transporter ATP-binding protein [Pseudomonadota bacterium]
MLRATKVSKSFGRFQALKDVDLVVMEGERRAIIGPNGAGKSTLFNVIAGQFPPTAGAIYLNGQLTNGLRPDQIWSHGLTRTFQRNQLFQGLTVWGNVELACAISRAGNRMSGSTRHRAVEEKAADVLRQVHLLDHCRTVVRNLAYGAQRQLELALALAGEPKLLLLDEPTAGMSPAETEAMLALMSGLARDITLLIVEHDMDVVFSIAESITVLHLGEVLAAGTRQEIQNNEQVAEVYMGRRGRS